MKNATIVLSLILSAALRAGAEGGPEEKEPARGGPCKAEAEKVCPGLKPGKGLMKCMAEHESELSPACRKRHEKRERGMGKMKDACGSDAEKFCAGMRPGDGKFGPCMKEHKDELSAECRGMMGKMHDRREKRRERKGKGGEEPPLDKPE